MCAASTSDSEVMTIVKHKILFKLDSRLPEPEAVLIHQLLDPSTKHMIAQDVNLEHMENVTSRLSKKGLKRNRLCYIYIMFAISTKSVWEMYPLTRAKC